MPTTVHQAYAHLVYVLGTNLRHMIRAVFAMASGAVLLAMASTASKAADSAPIDIDQVAHEARCQLQITLATLPPHVDPLIHLTEKFAWLGDLTPHESASTAIALALSEPGCPKPTAPSS